MPLGALLRCALLFQGAVQEPPHRLPGVETARVALEARVLDGAGRPIAGLGPSDFRLEVDGQRLTVESAFWVAPSAAPTPPPDPLAHAPGQSPATDPPPRIASGRRIVLLFQKGDGGRLLGLLRSTRHAERIAALMDSRDRTAVLVHDSQLRLHLDFTSDPQALRRVLSDSVLQRWPARQDGAGEAPGSEDSLAARLDGAAAREAASVEQALLELGRALASLPGEKTVVLFGWGFGELSLTGYRAPAYGPARDALQRARAAVFAVDFTDSDWHTLEMGLRDVARDTGGLFLKSNDNPEVALSRLAGVLAGHYVIAFEGPPSRRGRHRLALSLAGRRGTVLSRRAYVD
jgi:VWFA-related protein